MTYADVAKLKAFHDAENLGYPLLQDENAKHVNALGIRNEGYEEGHNMYGIPHPGVMFVDNNGIIRAKYAIPGYRSRPPFEELLAHISGLVAK